MLKKLFKSFLLLVWCCIVLSGMVGTWYITKKAKERNERLYGNWEHYKHIK